MPRRAPDPQYFLGVILTSAWLAIVFISASLTAQENIVSERTIVFYVLASLLVPLIGWFLNLLIKRLL